MICSYSATADPAVRSLYEKFWVAVGFGNGRHHAINSSPATRLALSIKREVQRELGYLSGLWTQLLNRKNFHIHIVSCLLSEQLPIALARGSYVGHGPDSARHLKHVVRLTDPAGMAGVSSSSLRRKANLCHFHCLLKESNGGIDSLVCLFLFFFFSLWCEKLGILTALLIISLFIYF